MLAFKLNQFLRNIFMIIYNLWYYTFQKIEEREY
jgi:hypothetical protein